MQILDGGGEAQRRERVQADAGQSWMLAAQATRKQGCQDVDSCRDGHVRTTTTASPGVQRVRPPPFLPTRFPTRTGANGLPTRLPTRISTGSEGV